MKVLARCKNWLSSNFELHESRLSGLGLGIAYVVSLVVFLLTCDNQFVLDTLANIVSVSAGIGLFAGFLIEVIGMIIAAAMRKNALKNALEDERNAFKKELDSKGIPYTVDATGAVRITDIPRRRRRIRRTARPTS